MKKALVALSLAALFAGSAAANAPVDRSTVVFQGSVVAQTCSFTNPIYNVGLPTVWAQDVGVKAELGKTEFKIGVQGCSEFPGKTAVIKADVEADKKVGDLLKNTRPTNVGLKVTDAEGQNVLSEGVAKEISLTKETSAGGYDPTALKELAFNVEYAKTDAQPAQAGPVVALLPFVIEYK